MQENILTIASREIIKNKIPGQGGYQMEATHWGIEIEYKMCQELNERCLSNDWWHPLQNFMPRVLPSFNPINQCAAMQYMLWKSMSQQRNMHKKMLQQKDLLEIGVQNGSDTNWVWHLPYPYLFAYHGTDTYGLVRKLIFASAKVGYGYGSNMRERIHLWITKWVPLNHNYS